MIKTIAIEAIPYDKAAIKLHGEVDHVIKGSRKKIYSTDFILKSDQDQVDVSS